MDTLAELLEPTPPGQEEGHRVQGAGRTVRRWSRVLGPAVLVGSILFAGFASGQSTSVRPDAQQAQVAWADPCGLIPRTQLGALLDGTLGATDDYREGAVARCLHRGIPGSEILFLDVQLVTEASLRADDSIGPLSGLDDVGQAMQRLREDSVTQATAVPGVGDEAWVVDTNIRTVWARQGAVLIGVVAAPAAGPDDVEAATAVAGLLLRAIAGIQT